MKSIFKYGRTAKLFVLAASALALLAMPAAGPVVAAIITPGVTTGVGYDDNVRLRKTPQSDFFAFITPRLDITAGPPDNELQANFGLSYSHYLKLTEYTRIESGYARLQYHHEFSKVTWFEVFDNYSTTYDPVEVTDTGGLIRVTDTEIRRTINTIGTRFQHNYDPFSHIMGEYFFLYRNGSGDTDNEVYANQVQLGWLHALNPQHHLGLVFTGRHDDWETSPNITEEKADATYYWLPDRRKTFYATVGGKIVRADDDNAAVRTARDYDIITAGLGYSHRYSPRLEWNIGAGWSHVEGDAATNAAAGSGFPVFNASITYRGQVWEIEGHAKATLDEYDFVGDNTGLTRTQSVGGYWRWYMARHWTFLLYADYIRDDYQQDPTTSGTDYTQGVIDTTRFGTRVDWRIVKDATISLDYRFLDRNAENDKDDRQQNRILLYLDYRWPNRW